MQRPGIQQLTNDTKSYVKKSYIRGKPARMIEQPSRQVSPSYQERWQADGTKLDSEAHIPPALDVLT